LSDKLSRECKRLDREQMREYIARYRRDKDIEARNALIHCNMDLVRYLAGKFANRGEPYEDLVQVGLLALIRAIDRFDPDKGVELSSFLIPTIVGEIEKHFRDKSWAMKIPRRLKELNLALGRAISEMTINLGRPPTMKELAGELDVSEEAIVEAQELGRTQNIISFSREYETDENSKSTRLIDHLGSEDGQLDYVEDSLALKGALRLLDRYERIALYFKFFENYSQTRIAEMLGISQMQVSRIQQKAVEKLRSYLTGGTL
jgi:RNA polymerase sigma-B factor